MVNNPLSILWIGKATVYEYDEVTDPETYQTKHELRPVVTDEPCRVSYKQEPSTNIATGVAQLTQVIILFIRPDIEIKAGSVIEVTQYGRTLKYKRSSKPAIYSNHQEVALELYEDKA
jgi:ABC-type uncharacterized transport system YnjBCD substrate-binding protein